MYKFKYGGKKGKTVRLKESTDKIVVRTKEKVDLQKADLNKSSRELVAQTDEIMSFPEAGISVRQIEADTTLEAVTKRDELRTELKQDEHVRFAGRVLEDAETGEVMLYTENFFIKFKTGTPEDKCLALISQYHLIVKMKLPFAELAWFIEAPEGTGLKTFEIAEQLLKEKEVELCHPEMVQERRNKDLSTLQWHLAETTVNGVKVNAHVHIQGAWKITKGKGITVAIIDDGVDIDHPEFKGRIVAPRDVTQNTDDPRPKEPDDNHGTPCAGVAAAAGLEASGTAPESNLMPIRLRNGLGSMAEAQAFAWAADHGADVISCSWGPADGRWWDPEDPVHVRTTMLPDSTRMAIDYAMTKGRNGKGCVVLFAAGNGNESTENDGYVSYPPVITVAACNDSGRRSVYSDFGSAVWVSFPSRDFLWKPFKHPKPATEGIFTTDRLSTGGYNVAGDYHNAFGGTSSACPGMAGVVALMLAANPALTPAQVKEVIRQSCDQIDPEGGEYDSNMHSEYYGHGRINAEKAVLAAQKMAKSSPSTEPGSILSGFVRYAQSGDIPFKSGEVYANKPGDKIIGISLSSKKSDLVLLSELHLSSLGLLSSAKGEYLGAKDSKRSIYGIGFSLSGSAAKDYQITCKAGRKAGKALVAKNGFIGVKSGRTTALQWFSLDVSKK